MALQQQDYLLQLIMYVKRQILRTNVESWEPHLIADEEVRSCPEYRAAARVVRHGEHLLCDREPARMDRAGGWAGQ